MIGQNRWPIVVLAVVLLAGPSLVSKLAVGPSFDPSTAVAPHLAAWGDPVDADQIARDVFDRVNRERVARGALPLVWHEDLAELAREWSLHMAIDDAYGHSPLEFRAHPDFVGSGENIAMGQTSALEVHVGWMRSDGHRENILRSAFDAIGVGIVCRADGAMMATQIFGVREAGSTRRPPVETAVEPIVATEGGPSCPVQSGLFD